MDAHTQGLLEFDKVREIAAGYASTSMGAESVRSLEPLREIEAIRSATILVTEMTEALFAGHAPPFGGVHDVRLVVRRAAIGTMLTAEQLLQISDTLTATGAFYRYRMRLDGRLVNLIETLAPIEDLGPLAKSITGCIDGRGHVVDAASSDLAEVRRKLSVLDDRVQHEIKKLLRDPALRAVLRYPNATVSGDHYVLPVAANHRQKIPGVVHRTSSTGETVFIEPSSVAALSAELAVLRADEDREIRRILRKLSAEIGRYARPIEAALFVITRIDRVTALARYSRDFEMSPATLTDDGRLWLRNARHPILESLFRNAPEPTEEPGRSGASSKSSEQRPSPPSPSSGHSSSPTQPHQDKSAAGSSPSTPLNSPYAPVSPLPSVQPGGSPIDSSGTPADPSAPSVTEPAGESRRVVPIDVRLGMGFNQLVITGPNTGGKTVALKTTGLLAWMAHCGMHIPAGEGSMVPRFSNILADIGDEQSLEQSLSTFSSHISRIATILQSADQHSLILLDELGAGTDPSEGAALGRAILDELDRLRCRTMVTTHLGDLKTYAFSNERAENGAVEFNIETLRPTYRLMIGQFGMSNAVKIARRLKLPKRLLVRARKYLKRRKGKTPELARLQQLREQAESAKTEALAHQHRADQAREEFLRKSAELDHERRYETQLREWRQRLQVGDPVWTIKFGTMAKVARINQAKGTVFVSVGIGQWEVFFNEILPEEPKKPGE